MNNICGHVWHVYRAEDKKIFGQRSRRLKVETALSKMSGLYSEKWAAHHKRILNGSVLPMLHEKLAFGYDADPLITEIFRKKLQHINGVILLFDTTSCNTNNPALLNNKSFMLMAIYCLTETANHLIDVIIQEIIYLARSERLKKQPDYDARKKELYDLVKRYVYSIKNRHSDVIECLTSFKKIVDEIIESLIFFDFSGKKQINKYLKNATNHGHQILNIRKSFMMIYSFNQIIKQFVFNYYSELIDY